MKAHIIYRKENWISKMLSNGPVIMQLVKGLRQNWSLYLCSLQNFFLLYQVVPEMQINMGENHRWISLGRSL